MSRTRASRPNGADVNKLLPEDRPAHDWYRFVLSFPPHLVREYLERFHIGRGQRLLDPFCGTGTTLVEARKRGIVSIGFEANPMAYFATSVKIDWDVCPDGFAEYAQEVAGVALAKLAQAGIQDDPDSLFARQPARGLRRTKILRTLDEERATLLLSNSISPLPLHKTLVLLECLNSKPHERYTRHSILALAKAIVYSISNLHFGPEVGVAPAKPDAPVISAWLTTVDAMVRDLRALRNYKAVSAEVHCADSREIRDLVAAESVDAVITSPPYPNEKDYTRTTRLESVLLGFINNKQELRALKKRLIRSNTRSVYKSDDDDRWIAGHPEIAEIAASIERRRLEMGKTSGFERMYHRVAKLYFGGMARHLEELRRILRPGARLAYVVGDQASYLQIMIRTGRLLSEIAQSLGYELESIDLFRTRLATATREQLREEVVVLRWPGRSR